MSTTQPIRNRESLGRFKDYYGTENPNPRNNTLIILGLNTALRISDMLQLKWKDIFDGEKKQIKEHLEIREGKTGKENMIALNDSIRSALYAYMEHSFCAQEYDGEQYLFVSRKGKNTPIGRIQAYRIIRQAASAIGLDSHISCHSMRKTFGYHAWKQGIQPALLMDLYNHSSYRITKRYLCIGQDEKDEVYRNINL
ncbi:MAG: tyrosine-type recombinase/integrase [Roseburia sp.]|nr:tyrosine-type recombinase/integrase [Roseburia sp.]MCM1278398.1 tyrosine-type recombinase/integrase [Robinsoniella sp.]